MRALSDRVAGHIVAATDPAATWHGLRVCALDGCQVRVPDTEQNREAFGSSGSVDDGSDSPFPLVRIVLATARGGRAIRAAALDASRVGELSLAARLVAEHPDLFTTEHLYVMDRNFLSFDFVEALHRGGRGAQVLIRVKDGVRLPVIAHLGPGEYLSYLRCRDRRRRIRVRVVEYDVILTDGTVSELFCLITTLLDPSAYPAVEIAEIYQQRWSASETTIGEAKSSITDAGPSRGPILRSEEPELLRQEIWAWLASSQLVRRSAHAATRCKAGIGTDQISFTTTRREATRCMTQSLLTATSSSAALANAADMPARAALPNLLTIDRDRHSQRRQKHRPKFPHTATTKPTTRGPLKVNLGLPQPDTS
jgi:Transposase DDE domain